MLNLTNNAQYNDKNIEQLVTKTRELLSHHDPGPIVVCYMVTCG
jgi:hypothetical protein